MKKKFISSFANFLKIVFTAVLILALLLNVFTLWSVGRIKRGESVKFGYFCAIIGSGSMEPTISINDLLIIKAAPQYQIGDVVTYISQSGSLVTHRVKEVSAQGYIAQGDANNIPDEEVAGQRVMGKVVFALPGVGGITDGILSPTGIVFLVCIFLLIYLIQRVRRDQDGEEQDKTTNILYDDFEK